MEGLNKVDQVPLARFDPSQLPLEASAYLYCGNAGAQEIASVEQIGQAWHLTRVRFKSGKVVVYPETFPVYIVTPQKLPAHLVVPDL